MENIVPRIGVLAVVIRNNKVLLGKRKNCIEAGRWSFPGGHLEFGENPYECAKRELLEETGLEALNIKQGHWTSNRMEGHHYIMLFLFVNEFRGEPSLIEPDKCEGWQWFGLENLPAPLFSPIVTYLEAYPLKD